MKQLLAALAFVVPLAAIAADENYPKGTVGYAHKVSKQICTNLIADITRNYNVSNLELRSHNLLNDSFVTCAYNASVQEIYGDMPAMIVALLNTTNNRFTIEIR